MGIACVCKFWNFGSCQLLLELFQVSGVWSGGRLERKLFGKRSDQAEDLEEAVRVFFSSLYVHSFFVCGVISADWTMELGEARFFALNGVAIVLEGAVIRSVKI